MLKNWEISDADLIKQGQGLVYQGTVTTYTSITSFACLGLAGFGNDFFASASYADWEVYALWDGGGAGAAPQGLLTLCSDYVSSTGTFTHTAFASGNLAVGDKVLLVHPILSWLGTKADAAATGAVTTTDFLSAYIKQVLNELLGTDGGWTNMSGATIASLDAGLQALAKVIGHDAANTFSTSVDGSARTTLEAAWTALAALIGTKSTAAAAGAVTTSDVVMGYLKQVVTNTYLLAEAADGADVFPASVANDSILAKIMASDDPASSASYNNSTDSLEAIRDYLTAIQGGSETLESLDDELDAMIDMAKTPDTTTITTIGTEETITALSTTNTNPMYLAGVWLGLENLAAGDMIKYRIYADWDDASIADQVNSDHAWMFGGVQTPKWVYKTLGIWVTYEVRVAVNQYAAGTQREIYTVLDIGQRGS